MDVAHKRSKPTSSHADPHGRFGSPSPKDASPFRNKLGSLVGHAGSSDGSSDVFAMEHMQTPSYSNRIHVFKSFFLLLNNRCDPLSFAPLSVWLFLLESARCARATYYCSVYLFRGSYYHDHGQACGLFSLSR